MSCRSRCNSTTFVQVNLRKYNIAQKAIMYVELGGSCPCDDAWSGPVRAGSLGEAEAEVSESGVLSGDTHFCRSHSVVSLRHIYSVISILQGHCLNTSYGCIIIIHLGRPRTNPQVYFPMTRLVYTKVISLFILYIWRPLPTQSVYNCHDLSSIICRWKCLSQFLLGVIIT